jgi:hypothetical protein
MFFGRWMGMQDNRNRAMAARPACFGQRGEAQ